jgi:hypothetical protein
VRSKAGGCELTSAGGRVYGTGHKTLDSGCPALITGLPRGLGAILDDLVRVAGRVVLVRSGVEEAGPQVGGGVGCDVQGSQLLLPFPRRDGRGWQRWCMTVCKRATQ